MFAMKSWDKTCDLHLDGVGGLSASDYWQMWLKKAVNLFAFHQGPGRVGTVLLGWNTRHEDQKRICAVVAVGGTGKSLIQNGLNEIERIARLGGADEMQFDTERMGLLASMARAGSGRKFRVNWSI